MRWGEPEPDFRRDRDRWFWFLLFVCGQGEQRTLYHALTAVNSNQPMVHPKIVGVLVGRDLSPRRDNHRNSNVGRTVLFQLALAAKISTSEESLRPGL
jgi:hypothetical protein